MGVFDRLERGLERAVKQPFARVFKAEVQPVEIASAMRGAMDDRAAVLGPHRTMVPNVFTIELAETDYERLSSYAHSLTDELVAAAEDHADAQRYIAPGPFEVKLTSGDNLETGIFRVRPAAKDGRKANRSAAKPTSSRPADSRSVDARPQAARGGVGEDPHPAYRPQAGGSAEPPGEREPRPSGHTQVFAAPGKSSGRDGRPSLEIDGRRVSLSSAVTSIGRDESTTIVLDDPGCSRRHAEIRISHDGPRLQVVLRDLGSTNGTYLNGDEVGTEELNDGDRITMGRTTLVFRVGG